MARTLRLHDRQGQRPDRLRHPDGGVWRGMPRDGGLLRPPQLVANRGAVLRRSLYTKQKKPGDFWPPGSGFDLAVRSVRIGTPLSAFHEAVDAGVQAVEAVGVFAALV